MAVLCASESSVPVRCVWGAPGGGGSGELCIVTCVIRASGQVALPV